jgi:hypothetical protein
MKHSHRRTLLAIIPLALTLVLAACQGEAHLAARRGANSESQTIAAPAPAVNAAAPGDKPGVRPGAESGTVPGAVPGAERGRIVQGPANIRSFSPADSAIKVDGATIDLRDVFADLGPDATAWYQHVLTLSNPYFEGRAPGTAGIEHAADYLQFHFEKLGLQPAFPATGADGSIGMARDGSAATSDVPGGGTSSAWTTFDQPFEFNSPNPKVSVRSALVQMNGEPLSPSDFAVLGNSAGGSVTGPVTFIGYSIEKGPAPAPAAEGEQPGAYTSFEESTDLTGRIALMLRYTPLNGEGKRLWDGADARRLGSIREKMAAALKRKPAAILLVNSPGDPDSKTELETTGGTTRWGRGEVPVIQLSQEAADRLIRAADPAGADLLAWRAQADRGAVRSVSLRDDVTVSIALDLERDDKLSTRNIGAVLPGKGSLADEWLVIGAHYDHVGYGYTGARPENIGKLHPGADDNASGTSGLLVTASRMAENYAEAEAAEGDDHLRSVLFLAFSGEEAGLHGSKHYVANPTIPADRISLMINMDMIGRLRSDNLSVQGTGTAEGFADILKPHFDASGLTIATSPGGRGPSDHASFYNGGIPVLFPFTGTHPEYHQPSDIGPTVNPSGAVKVLNLVESIAMDIAARPEPLKYILTNEAGPGGRPGGARVRLGVQPNYTADLETGIEVEGVSAGSAAEEAGIKPGDVLLMWNKQELTDGRKMFELMREHTPGDVVEITLLRGSQELTVQARLRGREEAQ